MIRLVFICLAMFASGVGQLQAAPIYDNGSLTPLVLVAIFSQGTQRLADDFSLAGAGTISSIQFWGSHWSSDALLNTGMLSEIIVYGDAAGLPDAGNVIGSSLLNLVSRIDTGFDHNDNVDCEYLGVHDGFGELHWQSPI